ncbi:hypothetical protein BGZ76_009828 [Entomortierella beljakovae]|nr:hypothetical protein BGZ76_009828 [Entomortierella beljakovae]
MNTASEFFKLPPEIITQIASKLTPAELCRLIQTCHQLKDILDIQIVWQQSLESRFGAKLLVEKYQTSPNSPSWITAPITDLKKLFWRLSRTTIPSIDMCIIHMNGHYWCRTEHPRCIFNPVAELRSYVCWFDVSAVMYSVPKGRYKIQWGCVMKNSGYHFEYAEFRAIVTADEAPIWDTTLPSTMSYHLSRRHELVQMIEPKTMLHDRPIIVQVPGELEVEHDYMNVFVQIREHRSGKSGLILDYVRLIKADDPKPWAPPSAAAYKVDTAV